MLLGPRGAKASLVCAAALGLLALSVISAALAAHLKGASVTSADSRILHAAFNPQEAPGDSERGPLPPRDGRSVVNTLTVAKGDTLMDLLLTAGSDGPAANAAIRALRKSFDPRKLRIGQELTVVLDTPDGSATTPMLSAVSLELSENAYVVVQRDGQRFVATRSKAPIVPLSADTSVAAGPRTTLSARKKDTLTGLLQRAGASAGDARSAAAALGRHHDPRRLRIGQELTVVFDTGDDAGQARLAAASLALDDGSFAVAARSVDGAFRAGKAREPLVPLFASPSIQATEDPSPAPGDAAVEQTAAPDKSEAESPVAPAPDSDAVDAAIVDAGAVVDAIVAEADVDAVKTVHVRKGDTLNRLLLRAGSDRRDAHAAITALRRHYDPRRLQPGQELTVAFNTQNGDDRPRLAAISVAIGVESFVVVGRGEDGRFAASRANEPLSAAMDVALFAVAPAVAPPKIVFAPEPDNALRKHLRLESGDTLMEALLRAGSGRRDAHAAITALRTRSDPRKLKTGQALTIVFAPDRGDDGPVLHSLSLAAEPGRSLEASRDEAGGFAVREVEMPMERVLVHAGSRIDSSLYQAATGAGVPLAVMMEIIRAFSFDVDFQRDIQRGDVFAVLFERYVGETGDVVREGKLLYAALTLSGRSLKIYRYPLADGLFDYFSDDGQSVRKALLRTPVDGARLSSGYGKRRHPILGYTRIHRGLDFAAPAGTPIVAAGDGVIERIGRNGAYGRYIRIRHKGKYSTAYAHLKGYAKGLKKGRRVRQGEVIGYVGSSGRSTGPHLHYEVLASGRQINPLKIKLPTGPKLKGDELAAFHRARRETEKQLAALPLVRHVADGRNPGSECGASIEVGRGPTVDGINQTERC